MSVEISPAHTLNFPRPLTVLVKRALLIHNPHSSPVAFKVKTTAPKQYCVRPNSGRIEPGESVEVSVLLQPLNDEPPPHAKCKDKFLVQSAFISPDEEMRTLAEMWSQTEKTNKSAINEQKIKCAYTAAEDGSTGANGIPEEPEEHAAGEQSRLMDESRVFAFGAPHDGLSHWTTEQEKVFDPTLFRNGGMSYWEEEKPKVAKKSRVGAPSNPQIPLPVKTAQNSVLVSLRIQADTLQQIYSAAESSPTQQLTNGAPRTPPVAVAVAAAPIPAHAETTAPAAPAASDIKPPLPPLSAAVINEKGPSPTNAALEQGLNATTSDSDKLQAALAEIERLRVQLSEAQGPQVTGLRKRNANGTQAGAETAVEKTKEVISGAQGVPVEVVGGLLLTVFVLTYLFF